MVQRVYPIHRFFHTFLGAAIAGLATGAILILVKNVLLKLEPALVININQLRPSFNSEVSNIGLFVGALIGGLSHPFFDGIMHRDVRPFAPWSDANPLLRVIGLDYLHLGCLLLGVLGLIFMAIRLSRERAG